MFMRERRSQVVTIAIGIALAALVFIIYTRRSTAAARQRKPPPDVSHVVADDAGFALGEVLLHYVPELESTFEPSYRDFLTTLSKETRIVFVLPKGRRGSLDAFLARIDPRHTIDFAARIQTIEITTSLGIWSKDRALVLNADGAGATTAVAAAEPRIPLLIPPRPRLGESSRPHDWDIIPSVAAAMPDRFEARELPVSFDAGDFAIAGKQIIFDVNLYTRNRTRYPSAIALRERVRSLLGRDVVMLGSADGDVPRHHMSMYMAPLDEGTVLVGDPAAGARIVGDESFKPGELSPETGAPLRADFSKTMQARFDRAAKELAASGFRVVRIPTIPFDDKTYFAYTNGIYETRKPTNTKKTGGGRRIAWVPRFDVPALDSAAHGIYASLGFEVIPVSVRNVYAQHGTIGCMVNVLRRQ
jgi:hypothetical protein